jgi:ribonuclease III
MTASDAQLEDRLGHKFSKPALLDRALTHSSAIPELRLAHFEEAGDQAPLRDEPQDNEQLEFLGDAVLDMLASEHLLETFPEWSEGQLSKSRARIVNASALEMAARRLRLGEHLRLGRGEEKTAGREKPALLANAFEAVVAAIYLDAGLEAVREMLRRTLFDFALEERGESLAEADRKSALQEYLQGRGQAPAEYRLVGESGPDHQKQFQVEVWMNGSRLADGAGMTKKEAEQQAASRALERLLAQAVVRD